MPHVYAHAVELATTVLTVAGMGYYLVALVAGSAVFSRGKTEQNALEFLRLARAASPAQV